ncbi:MAG: hypothetical protein L0271_09320 [Gemmatimonadetes bacterium]|nr:hypothetical protein [Gemmatimonadota bacterium]
MSQSKSPFQKPRLRIAAVASALMLALPGAATADSNAVTGACLEDEATVRACSSKELSNVVVQCSSESGSYFVKIDELDDGTYEGLISPNEGLFSCPEGEVLAVFIKSGVNFYEGAEIAGLPPGSGALWSPFSCDVEDAGCSSEGGEDGGGDGEGGTDEGVDPPE